jgi:enoyl-CoA hydratase
LDYVRVEREDGVAVLTIDRQEKLNALDGQVVEEIGQALLELEADAPRAIVVTGAGERSFIAGADIKAYERHDPFGGQALLGDRARRRGPPRPEPRPHR